MQGALLTEFAVTKKEPLADPAAGVEARAGRFRARAVAFHEDWFARRHLNSRDASRPCGARRRRGGAFVV
jgi:hypothetical protein